MIGRSRPPHVAAGLRWLAAAALAACGSGSSAGEAGSSDEGGIELGACPAAPLQRALTAAALPPAGAAFDYQLGGAYEPPAGVTVLVRDREDPPAPGVYGICYVNAFQSQPETDWSGDRATLLLRDPSGLVEDPSWPGEYLFDLSTPERREQLVDIVGEWIAECAAAGYDAVELDNLDTFTRVRGRFGLAETGMYGAGLLARAHESGLAVAQKNTAEASACFRQLGFDFAIAEECWHERECDEYTDAYGERVFDVEYDGDAYAAGCRAGRAPQPIRRDRELVPPGPGYVREQCR